MSYDDCKTNGFFQRLEVKNNLSDFLRYCTKLSNRGVAFLFFFEKAYLFKSGKNEFLVFLDYKIMFPFFSLLKMKWLIKWAFKKGLRKNKIGVKYLETSQDTSALYLIKTIGEV